MLEDNFGTSFAGKYDSVFCPNQGTLEENLFALTNAITHVYASSVNPDALVYRHQNGLADYDERIAILIQYVEGEQFGRYYLPHGAGVAFSRNLYRWSPQIRQEDGFLRLVWGLGTRAVDQVADDYPRLVALSHPKLHPASDLKSIRRYSQQNLDVIDIKANEFRTIPASEVLNPRYPPLRYIVQVEQDGYLGNMRSNMVEPEDLVITYEGLLARTAFPITTCAMHWNCWKLTTNLPLIPNSRWRYWNPQSQKPDVRITLLQCRPQSHIQESSPAKLPRELLEKDIIFSTQRMVPQGLVEGIRYVLFVSPEGYFSISTQAQRTKLIRAIGQLNAALRQEIFIAIGPGRWGTSTPDLGVHVAYGDIYNARSLVELSGESVGTSPEPSFGTHFFQDLMEAQIYPLAVFLDDKDILFNHDFFYNTPNCVLDFIPVGKRLTRTLRLLAVKDFRPNHHMDLVMDGQKGRAVAYLVQDEDRENQGSED